LSEGKAETKRGWGAVECAALIGLLALAIGVLAAAATPAQQEQTAQSQGAQSARGTSAAQGQGAAAAGGVPQAQGKPIQVQANLVNVLATVKDKHGKIVANLTKDEFTVTEDGKPQTITYFVADTDVPLTLGLLIDTSLSQRRVLGQERDASQKFLDDMLRADKDKAFVIHFDYEVELLQDLTASKEKLEKALEQIESPQFAQTRGGGGSPDPDDPDPPQTGRHHAGGGTLLYDSVYLASNELMKKQQGRKAVVVLTDGVDRGSKVSLEEAIDAAQRADTMVYTIYYADEEQPNDYHHGGWGHVGMGGGGMGGPGGQWPGGGRQTREPRPDGKKVLQRLSSATGGEMFQASKKETVDQIYARIAEELRNQYSIGYVPDHSTTGGGFHKIAVTTKDKDLVVQTREGYYAEK